MVWHLNGFAHGAVGWPGSHRRSCRMGTGRVSHPCGPGCVALGCQGVRRCKGSEGSGGVSPQSG